MVVLLLDANFLQSALVVVMTSSLLTDGSDVVRFAEVCYCYQFHRHRRTLRILHKIIVRLTAVIIVISCH